MNSWFRQHLYAMRVACRRLVQTPFSSLSNIVVIAFVLALPIIASGIIISLAPLGQQVSVNPTITSYMTLDSSLEETQQLARDIEDKYGNLIEDAEVIDKTTALEKLKHSPSWSEAIQTLQNNPLPHAIIITLQHDTKNFDDAAKAQQLVQALQNYDQIDLVQFDSQWVRKLNTILKFGVTILILLAIGVTIVVVGTIFNTVRMQALVQRDEIAVARLLGATESFVCRPFLYFGAITGLLGGLLSVLFSAIMLMAANHVMKGVNEEDESAALLSFSLPDFWWLVIAVLLTMAIAALAARWSVSKTSRF